MQLNKKSRITSLALTILLGPIGLFYSSAVAGFIMLIISIGAAAASFGASLLITWPLCVAIGDHCTHKHNKGREEFLKAVGRG